ncbi:MAG TPA: 50S ribosomal protein L24 [Candidatus Saccharimonadales bacterium]|nr:50S ribosomal protein L24 [Candidatus Saccharimonadales bacterium]
MKIHTKDKVKIIAGKDKGKEGTVLRVFTDTGRVLVEGVNKVKRHVKPGAASKEGGIISIERPIAISNVMYIDTKSGKPVKLGFRIVDNKKYRISKESGEVIGLAEQAPKAKKAKGKMK